MVSVKSSVQAVDPACGIWLVGKVLDEREDAFNIRWANYRVSDWVSKDKVRTPVPKRQCRLDTKDWPLTQPSLLQKGEEVCVKKADGTSGEFITVEENDPFNCVILGNDRRLKYEWIREVELQLPQPSDREPLAELVTNHTVEPRRNSLQKRSGGTSQQTDSHENQENETPRRRPAQKKRRERENASSGAKRTKTLVPKKILGNDRRLKYEWIREVELQLPQPSDREPLAELVTNHTVEPRRNSLQKRSGGTSQQTDSHENQENETPRRRPAQKKRRERENASSGAKRTKTLVPKKAAARIAIGPAADPDDGGPPQQDGMATGCADAATMALHSVLVTATAEGNPPPLPKEWSRATPAFGCSALCDGRFAELTLKLQEQAEQLKELRKCLDDLQKKLEPQPRSTAFTGPESPTQPELSSVVGVALQTITSPPPEQPQTDSQSSPMHMLLGGCAQDRAQMAKVLMKQYFTTSERMTSNTSGKRGKTPLDPRRLSEIRRVIFDFAPVPTFQAEENEWTRLKAIMDQSNRHLRQHLREKVMAE